MFDICFICSLQEATVTKTYWESPYTTRRKYERNQEKRIFSRNDSNHSGIRVTFTNKIVCCGFFNRTNQSCIEQDLLAHSIQPIKRIKLNCLNRPRFSFTMFSISHFGSQSIFLYIHL